MNYEICEQKIIDNLTPFLLFKKDLVFCKKCPCLDKCNKIFFDFNIVHFDLY